MDITRDALPKTLHKIKGSSNCSCTNRKKRKGNSILRRVVPRLHFPVDETGSLSPLDFPEKPKILFLCVKVCVWGGRQGIFDFFLNYHLAKWLLRGLRNICLWLVHLCNSQQGRFNQTRTFLSRKHQILHIRSIPTWSRS